MTERANDESFRNSAEQLERSYFERKEHKVKL